MSNPNPALVTPEDFLVCGSPNEMNITVPEGGGNCIQVPDGWITKGDYSYRDCPKSVIIEKLAYLGCRDMGPGCGVICSEYVAGYVFAGVCPDTHSPSPIPEGP